MTFGLGANDRIDVQISEDQLSRSMDKELWMNIFSVPYLSRSLLLLSLVIAITACATLPGTFEVQLQPEAQAISQITVLDELKPVLDAILFGSIEQRREHSPSCFYFRLGSEIQ